MERGDGTCIANHEVDGGRGVSVHRGCVCALCIQSACVDGAVRWLAHIVYRGAGPLVDLQTPHWYAGTILCELGLLLTLCVHQA